MHHFTSNDFDCAVHYNIYINADKGNSFFPEFETVFSCKGFDSQVEREFFKIYGKSSFHLYIGNSLFTWPIQAKTIINCQQIQSEIRYFYRYT